MWTWYSHRELPSDAADFMRVYEDLPPDSRYSRLTQQWGSDEEQQNGHVIQGCPPPPNTNEQSNTALQHFDFRLGNESPKLRLQFASTSSWVDPFFRLGYDHPSVPLLLVDCKHSRVIRWQNLQTRFHRTTSDLITSHHEAFTETKVELEHSGVIRRTVPKISSQYTEYWGTFVSR